MRWHDLKPLRIILTKVVATRLLRLHMELSVTLRQESSSGTLRRSFMASHLKEAIGRTRISTPVEAKMSSVLLKGINDHYFECLLSL